MKTVNYVNPQTNVVKIQVENALLAGSQGTGTQPGTGGSQPQPGPSPAKGMYFEENADFESTEWE